MFINFLQQLRKVVQYSAWKTHLINTFELKEKALCINHVAFLSCGTVDDQSKDRRCYLLNASRVYSNAVPNAELH